MASTVAAFLERKDIEVTFQRYAIDALSAMAQGLFASLLIGTILSTVGDLSGLAFFNQIGTFAKSVAGPAMAIAIGYALHTPPLVLFSLAAVGFAANDAGGAGGPLAALTLPISSAAICAALGLTGLAGGAALAGCCAQMVGFAVLSFRENRWGGLLSQGLGTSMLQMGNIVKKPLIWVPAIVASAVTGPVATCVFQLSQNGPAVASGMGTCGLVGPIGVYTGWISGMEAGAAAPGAFDWIGLALVCFVLPALIAWAVGALMRKAGLIAEGDLLLEA